MKKPSEIFAENLKRYAGEMTQHELAAKIGVSRAAIGHWMQGKRLPHLDMFPKIAQALEIEHWQALVSEHTEDHKKSLVCV